MESAVKDVPVLMGMRVAFTGKLASMSRREAVALVRTCGGEVVTSVTKLCSLLVVGQESDLLTQDGRPTPRIRKARQLLRQGCSITILPEMDFLRRCGVDAQEHSIRQLYTESQVCRLLKIPSARLRRWLKSGLVEPFQSAQGIAYFDFQQVSWAKTLYGLTEAGVKSDKIRRSLRQLKQWLTPSDPLTQLSLLEKDGQLLVRLENGQLSEPHGQPHLDFEGEELHSRSLAQHVSQRGVEDWFQTGVRLEDAGNYEEAAHAYEQALLQNGPDALTCFNLANVWYQLGQLQNAVNRFQQAVEIDSSYPDAWNNLGNVQYDLGEKAKALQSFQRALSLAPHHSDYHYNLADLLDELGRMKEAQKHWRMYLQGGEAGQWADYARDRLAAASS